MDLLLEGAEDMGRQHDVAILLEPQLIDGRLDFAYEPIQLDVPLLDDVRPRAHEHVLHTVQAIEDAGQHALAELAQLVEEYLLPLREDQVAQVKELLVGDAAFFETVGVLRPAERQEASAHIPRLLD